MKITKKEFDIFNLSFLDVISCGFGAVVLLVLISNTAEAPSPAAVDEVESLLGQVISIEKEIDSLAQKIDQQKKKSAEQLVESGALDRTAANLARELGQIDKNEQKLAGDLQGLSLVQESLERVSITPSTSTVTRDEEVGGIPVDSDYVVFVVDTSGSMQSIWGRVSREMQNVLSIHPRIKGFQILNDQGIALISGYSGRWIPDTPPLRERVMKVFATWQDASNSSPVEGIETALKRYAKPGQATAIYVFGDDYTGALFDPVIAAITRLNKMQPDGRPLAKIHAVGFLSRQTTGRFGILMRELTRKNGGTFLALPL